VSTTLIRARGLRLAFSDELRSLPAPRPSHLDLAIEHFVQAGIFSKAIEAAISARKWNRAV
jgi:hypothetical protein